MANQQMSKGYFSLLRWRSDAIRDEAKNLAVILVAAEGEFGGVKTVPPSKIDKGLRDRGIVQGMVEAISQRFDQENKPDLGYLRELHDSLQRSLVVTEPRPVAVTDVDSTLEALYKAYLKPRSQGGSRSMTRGTVLNQAVNVFQERGLSVEKEGHLDSYPFGLIIRNGSPEMTHVAEALSFASSAATEQRWVDEERIAGSFIFAANSVELPHFAIIEPPGLVSLEPAYDAHSRVVGWFDSEGIRVVTPAQLDEVAASIV